MEKYSRFADPHTGINPFIPDWSLHSLTTLGWVQRLLRHSTFVLVALSRYFNVFVISLFLALTNVFLDLTLSCYPYLKYKVWAYITYPAYRLLLLNFGVWVLECNIDDSLLHITRDDSDNCKKIKPSELSTIVFSNYTGIIDVIYLTCKFTPMFVMSTSDNKIALLSPTQMMAASLENCKHDSKKLTPKAHIFTSLDTLIEFAHVMYPYNSLIIFPEAAKSNGNCILKWDNVTLKQQSGSVSNCNVYDILRRGCVIVMLQYRKASFTPPHTVYSGWYHMMRLMFEVGNVLTITSVAKDQMAEIVDRHAESIKTVDGLLELFQKVMKFLSAGSIQIVDVDGSKLQEFSEYFKSTQSLRYKKNH